MDDKFIPAVNIKENDDTFDVKGLQFVVEKEFMEKIKKVCDFFNASILASTEK